MSDWRNPLPLRLIVMADFGLPTQGGPISVSAAGFDEALKSLAPSVTINVPDRLGGGGTHEVTVDLSSAGGFHPDRIIEGFPALATAVAERKASADGEDAEADALLGAQLDVVLHHPDVQRVEAAWRGLRFLLDGTGEDGNVVVEILPAQRANLVERFRAEVFDPEYAGTEIPATAVLLDFDFDHRAHLMAPLEELSELARILQVMLVASTGPELFGLKSLLHLTALKDLSSRLAAPIYKRIQEFQKTEDARWSTLTLNRVLLRNLYEPGVGGVDSFDYREQAEAARPETYLWGRGIWMFGRNLAQSFIEHGHCADASGNTGAPFHQGLPVREVPISRTETGWSSVEVAIDESNANALTRMGMTTMVGRANANFAYFPLLVNLHRAIPGHLSLNGAVAQQLFAGHLSHFTLKLLASAPTEAADEEVQAHFLDGFTSFLGPIGGEGAVSVDVAEREGNVRTARIQVKPTLEIEEKEIDLTFELPI